MINVLVMSMTISAGYRTATERFRFRDVTEKDFS